MQVMEIAIAAMEVVVTVVVATTTEVVMVVGTLGESITPIMEDTIMATTENKNYKYLTMYVILPRYLISSS